MEFGRAPRKKPIRGPPGDGNMTRREDPCTARSPPHPPVNTKRLQHRVDVAARPRNGAHVGKPADEGLDVGAKGPASVTARLGHVV